MYDRIKNLRLTLKTNRTYDTGISITASAGASGKQ